MSEFDKRLDGKKQLEEMLAKTAQPPESTPSLIRLPVGARPMNFGSEIWFVDDADGRNLAQIIPSTNEDACRELARLVNIGAAAGKLIQVAELASKLDTSQVCDPAHHELVVLADEALRELRGGAK